MVRSAGGVQRRGMMSPYKLLNISTMKNRKGQEDEILIQMVDAHSSKDWSSIARAVPGRSRKQCRDRWTHYLDPAVNQMPWSEQEEIDLIRTHKIHGNKWCELAKLFPGRTGKAVKNYWTGTMKKKIKSNLHSGSPEQLSPYPNDSSIPIGRDSTATSSQDSSNNIQVSSADLPVRPKSKHGLVEACRNACTLKEEGPDSIHDDGSAPHSVNVSQTVDGRTVGSSLPILTEEILVLPLSSVDEKVSCVAANSPKPLKEEESTNFLEIPPAFRFQSSNVHSDVICSSADPESRQLHLASIADLLDMPYCESLMVIAPDSANDEDFVRGM